MLFREVSALQTSGRSIRGGKRIYENGADGRTAGDWNSLCAHLTGNGLRGKRLGLLNWVEVWAVIAVAPGYCKSSSSLKVAVLKMHKVLILEKKLIVFACVHAQNQNHVPVDTTPI